MKSKIKYFSITQLFNKKEKRNLSFLYFLMIINSILEVFAIGLIIPLIQLIISNDNINSELINSIANYFEISGYDFLKIIIMIYLLFQIFIKFILFFIYGLKIVTYKNLKKLSSKLLTPIFSRLLILFKNHSAKLMRNITYCVDSAVLYLFQFLKLSLDIIIALFIFIFLLFYNFKVTIILSLFF